MPGLVMFFFSPMLFFFSGELPGVQWPSPGRGAGVTLRSFQRVFHSASKAAARRVPPASAGVGSEDARCLHGGDSLAASPIAMLSTLAGAALLVV